MINIAIYITDEKKLYDIYEDVVYYSIMKNELFDIFRFSNYSEFKSFVGIIGFDIIITDDENITQSENYPVIIQSDVYSDENLSDSVNIIKQQRRQV